MEENDYYKLKNQEEAGKIEKSSINSMMGHVLRHRMSYE